VCCTVDTRSDPGAVRLVTSLLTAVRLLLVVSVRLQQLSKPCAACAWLHCYHGARLSLLQGVGGTAPVHECGDQLHRGEGCVLSVPPASCGAPIPWFMHHLPVESLVCS
jgi:hypothetical protein